jgi:hypothetical protein
MGWERGAQIPGDRLPWRLKFVWWHLKTVDPRYGTCLISPIWLHVFWGGSYSCEKFVHPWAGSRKNCSLNPDRGKEVSLLHKVQFKQILGLTHAFSYWSSRALLLG